MTTITSPIKLSRPSAAVSRAMTDKERVAMQAPGLSLVADPSERALEYSRLALRDRVGCRIGTNFGGVPATINANPGISFAGQDGVNIGIRFSFVLPRSYFIAGLIDLANTTNTSAVFSVASDQPAMFFGVLSTGALRLHHGVANGIQMTGLTTGRHVVWASYDHLTGAAAVGADAVTQQVSGNIAVEFVSSETSWTWGGPSNLWGLNGVGGPVAVLDRALLGPAAAARRSQVLSWLAEYGQTTLAA